MNLNYVLMPAGVLCLGIPSLTFCSSRLREKMRQPARRRESGMQSLARAPQNWIDLARGAAGAWMIQHVVHSVQAGQDELALAYLVAEIALVFVAVVAQTVWLGRPLRVIGPGFFLTGLALVFCGPLVAGFAVTLGLVCALLFRRFSLMFAFVPAALAAFGALFGQLGIMTLVTIGAFALPPFLSFALNIRLAYARRPVQAAIPVAAAAPVEVPAHPEGGGGIIITPDFATGHIEVARESLA